MSKIELSLDHNEVFRTDGIPKIVKGGNIFPIGIDSFLVKGRKPKKTDDVDVDIIGSKKGVEVFSAQNILDGKSPAKLFLSGANPDRVFAAQEQYKDAHGINNDGSKKKAKGGSVVNWIKNVLGINSNNTKSPVKGDDNDFYTNAEKLAKYQSSKFNISEEEALYNILNSKDYNYRGYFEEFGNLEPDSDGHFTDRYKTVYHDTFSDESIYSGKKSQYNPEGKVGGSWDDNGNFIENKKQYGGMTNKENNANILGYVPSTKKRKKALMGSDGKEYTDVTQMPAGVTPKLHDLDWSDQNAYKAPTYVVTPGLNPINDNNKSSQDEKDIIRGKRAVNAEHWLTYGLGAGTDILSTIIGSSIEHSTTNKRINEMKGLIDKIKAYQIPSIGLKTRYNANPQISEINNDLRIIKKNIDADTESSQRAIARKQAADFNARLEKNKVYAQKENIETGLINESRKLHAKTIAENIRNNQNVENQKLLMQADIVDKQSENDANLTRNIVGGVNSGIRTLLTGLNEQERMMIAGIDSPEGDNAIYGIKGKHIREREEERERKLKERRDKKSKNNKFNPFEQNDLLIS